MEEDIGSLISNAHVNITFRVRWLCFLIASADEGSPHDRGLILHPQCAVSLLITSGVENSPKSIQGINLCPDLCRDVNKDLAPKDQDKDKDLTPKDQDKDKDLTPRTRTRTRTSWTWLPRTRTSTRTWPPRTRTRTRTWNMSVRIP